MLLPEELLRSKCTDAARGRSTGTSSTSRCTLAYAVGILFWLKIDATKPIIAEDECRPSERCNNFQRKPTLILISSILWGWKSSIVRRRKRAQVDSWLGKVENQDI